MVVLRKLRVYQELIAVLASILVVVALSHHRSVERAYAADVDDAETLSPAGMDSDAASSAPPDTSASSSQTTPSTPPPPQGKERVLVLGDSMVEVLAPSLNAYAIENGHEIVPAIWYGSTTAAWARTPELGRLLREINPTMVIVVLGSSELTSPSIESRRPFVQTILKRIGQRKIIWVGPPNWRADTGINDLLEAELGKDRFFRSEHLELTRKKDGIHPDAAGGRVWTDAIATWLGHESRFAITLQPPSKPAAAPPAHVLGAM
jgi:hypothetical protein